MLQHPSVKTISWHRRQCFSGEKGEMKRWVPLYIFVHGKGILIFFLPQRTLSLIFFASSLTLLAILTVMLKLFVVLLMLLAFLCTSLAILCAELALDHVLLSFDYWRKSVVIESTYYRFLDAPLHLCKRVCPSVGLSVHWSVHRSVSPSLRRLLSASYA